MREKGSLIARFMGPTWGPSGPTGPRWASCWPHELCYLGSLLLTRRFPPIRPVLSPHWMTTMLKRRSWTCSRLNVWCKKLSTAPRTSDSFSHTHISVVQWKLFCLQYRGAGLFRACIDCYTFLKLGVTQVCAAGVLLVTKLHFSAKLYWYCFNSWSCGRCGCDFKCVNFKQEIHILGMGLLPDT